MYFAIVIRLTGSGGEEGVGWAREKVHTRESQAKARLSEGGHAQAIKKKGTIVADAIKPASTILHPLRTQSPCTDGVR